MKYRFEMTEDENIVSERVHDLESDSAERLNHYVHYFLMGKIPKDELQQAFDSIVQNGESIPDVWEERS